jgi:hypothetical protein
MLLLRLTSVVIETGRRCAAELGRTGSPNGSRLGRRGADLHFHYAFGFRPKTSLRLAHMLDSLVRVSRRVGWATDLLAADHKCHRGSSVQPTAGPESPAATRGVQQPGALPARLATARLSRRRARARVSNASSVGRRSRVEAGYNSDRSRILQPRSQVAYRQRIPAVPRRMAADCFSQPVAASY